jgi:PAS domain S-box-containing protein
LTGVLYLENNLAPHVFTPARIAVLKLLASQAAISLENTRLYRDLQEREAKIRRLVDANIIGILIWNLEGRIVEANEAFLHMVGYGREDLLSGRMSWSEGTPDKWREADERALAELAATGACEPFEKEYFRKDGSRVPVLIGAALLEGRRDEGVAFVLDLSERKRADEALRQSEEQWRDVFENNPTMYFMVDAAGMVLAVNPFGAEMLGYRVDELVGQPVLSVFDASDREAVKRHVAQCLGHLGRANSWEARKVRKDGTVLWVRETAKAVPRANGPIVLIACEDMTGQRNAAEALHQAQADLAHVSRVTTLGEMAASIAHEVDQPLSGVVINANACLRFLNNATPDLDEVREGLQAITRDGRRASDVIARIRFLARGTATEKERLDINDVIREVVTLAEGESHRTRARLRTELAADLPRVLGDPVQLQQVVLNLLLNGLEAMHAVVGRPRELVIRTQREATDGVRVVVQDSGSGIDPQLAHRIFDAFYTTKRSGMGMGLSISRSIVEQHGGRLWAVPNDGPGTTFLFTL